MFFLFVDELMSAIYETRYLINGIIDQRFKIELKMNENWKVDLAKIAFIFFGSVVFSSQKHAD